jgi:hypothetical protein
MKDAASFPRTQKREVLFVDIVGKNETLNPAFIIFFLGRLPVGHRSFACMEWTLPLARMEVSMTCIST